MPAANYLQHLVEQRRAEGFLEPTPRQLAEQATERRWTADQAIVDLFAETLDADVFDEATVRDFLARYGPFDGAVAARTLDRMCVDGNDRHVAVYLEAVRDDAMKDGGHE